MKLRAPIVTLAVVGVLGLVLIAVNVFKAPEPAANQAADAGAQASKAAEPAAAQSTEASATPSKPPETPEEGAYIGHTSTGDIWVAVAIADGKAAAYVCNGEDIEAWLQGEFTGGTLTLKGKNEAKLTASVDGDALFGRISVGGKKWPYSAALADPPAGLYEGEGTVNGESARIGWIVLPDGRQVGIVSLSDNDLPAPPIDLDKGGANVNGVFIEARRISGDDLLVRP